MWYEERIKKNKFCSKLISSLCYMKGKIMFLTLKGPPQLLYDLSHDNDLKTKEFIENIYAYNMMFPFTSLGGDIDSSINQGSGPYFFCIHG